jgi:hypothetical protein
MMPAPSSHFGQNASTAFAMGWQHGHGQPQPHALAYATPTPSPSPFSLETGRDDDTGLFKDARIGFSHLLPGRPSLAMPQPGDPPADVTVRLQDAPITVRYRLESARVQASSAAELAWLTAERFAAWRVRGSARVELATPSWLRAWGSESAAVASYEVPAPCPAQEDLFVVVRQGALYVVTWTYPRAFTADPAYASFASVAEATMIWDSTRWDQRGRVWPESAFVGPGIHVRPKPRHNEAARWLSRLPLADDDRARIFDVLSGIVSNAGAPWVELGAEVIDQSCRAIASAVRSPEIHAYLQGAFAEVRTAHDLRGLAVLLGRALDRQ